MRIKKKRGETGGKIRTGWDDFTMAKLWRLKTVHWLMEVRNFKQICLKVFRSYGVKHKRRNQYANKYGLLQPFFGEFAVCGRQTLTWATYNNIIPTSELVVSSLLVRGL